ncbi:MAG TPA: DsbA family protein [Nitrosopumilaceae archaeon]|nr:DsbA family protein [Nitrosopumilaceae archaeon]
MIKGLVAAIIVAAFVGGYTISEISDDESITKEDFQELVDVIKESNQPVQPTTVREPAPQAPSVLKTVSSDNNPLKGNPNAPVTIIEFSDFQCPFCARFFEQTLPLIEKNYVETGIVNLVYRDFPLDFHKNALPAHIASECADEQNAFWEYHDVLFDKQSEWQSLGFESITERFLAYAEELGLDQLTFTTCLQSNEIVQEIQSDLLSGRQYGATGTPTFFIGNEKFGYTKISGAQPYQNFASVIESKLS